jgi:hypothetical protein
MGPHRLGVRRAPLAVRDVLRREPGAIKGREYRTFDWTAAERLVDQCLQSYNLRTTAASTPDPPGDA